MSIDRRQFINAAAGAVLLGSGGRSPLTAAVPNRRVFTLSVASGDPSPTGVMLWTRVNPDALIAGRSLLLEVAADDSFSTIVFAKEFPGHKLRPEHDFTIKINLDGRLAPNSVYFYRFVYDGETSPVGRCRTLPAPNDRPDNLRFGLLTCQDFTNGYYGALSAMAEMDVDFVLHLGDFIYETQGDPLFQSLPFPDREIVLPSGQIAATDLQDFRFIYRTYRGDPNFQRLLERHTIISIWDDHETANDCYWDYERDTLGAPDHPFGKGPGGGDPGMLRQLKLDSQQAWSEYVPARPRFDAEAMHPFDALRIYRRFRFGDLAELFMTDERTYRNSHPCGSENRYLAGSCPAVNDPSRTMLGGHQRDWLAGGVTQSRSLWKLWGNSVFLGSLDVNDADTTFLYANLDAWDGYEAERRQLMERFQSAGVENLVALTGDLHTAIAAEMRVDYRTNRLSPNDGVVGVEFMTPAITSRNFREIFATDPDNRWQAAATEPMQPPELELLIRASNPHVRYFDGWYWGFSTLELTRTDCVWSVYRVDKSVAGQTPPPVLERSFLVPSGTNRLIQLV